MQIRRKPHVQTVKEHAAKENAEVVVICAKLEAELVALEEAGRTRGISRRCRRHVERR
jgi:ribosome-binding ATPase YchF (GTP1/OBG family)